MQLECSVVDKFTDALDTMEQIVGLLFVSHTLSYITIVEGGISEVFSSHLIELGAHYSRLDGSCFFHPSARAVKTGVQEIAEITPVNITAVQCVKIM